jgi:hypothetical protein
LGRKKGFLKRKEKTIAEKMRRFTQALDEKEIGEVLR